MLVLSNDDLDGLYAHALRGYPLEACGLLIGQWQGDEVHRFVPTPNAAASSRIYEVDGRTFMPSNAQPMTMAWPSSGWRTRTPIPMPTRRPPM